MFCVVQFCKAEIGSSSWIPRTNREWMAAHPCDPRQRAFSCSVSPGSFWTAEICRENWVTGDHISSRPSGRTEDSWRGKTMQNGHWLNTRSAVRWSGWQQVLPAASERDYDGGCHWSCSCACVTPDWKAGVITVVVHLWIIISWWIVAGWLNVSEWLMNGSWSMTRGYYQSVYNRSQRCIALNTRPARRLLQIQRNGEQLRCG